MFWRKVQFNLSNYIPLSHYYLNFICSLWILSHTFHYWNWKLTVPTTLLIFSDLLDKKYTSLDSLNLKQQWANTDKYMFYKSKHTQCLFTVNKKSIYDNDALYLYSTFDLWLQMWWFDNQTNVWLHGKASWWSIIPWHLVIFWNQNIILIVLCIYICTYRWKERNECFNHLSPNLIDILDIGWQVYTKL